MGAPVTCSLWARPRHSLSQPPDVGSSALPISANEETEATQEQVSPYLVPQPLLAELTVTDNRPKSLSPSIPHFSHLGPPGLEAPQCQGCTPLWARVKPFGKNWFHARKMDGKRMALIMEESRSQKAEGARSGPQAWTGAQPHSRSGLCPEEQSFAPLTSFLSQQMSKDSAVYTLHAPRGLPPFGHQLASHCHPVTHVPRPCRHLSGRWRVKVEQDYLGEGQVQLKPQRSSSLERGWNVRWDGRGGKTHHPMCPAPQQRPVTRWVLAGQREKPALGAFRDQVWTI